MKLSRSATTTMVFTSAAHQCVGMTATLTAYPDNRVTADLNTIGATTSNGISKTTSYGFETYGPVQMTVTQGTPNTHGISHMTVQLKPVSASSLLDTPGSVLGHEGQAVTITGIYDSDATGKSYATFAESGTISTGATAFTATGHDQNFSTTVTIGDVHTGLGAASVSVDGVGVNATANPPKCHA